MTESSVREEAFFSVDEWLVDPDHADSLKCAFCLDLLHQPVNLSTCPHTFCRPCLQGYVDGEQTKCPLCIVPLSINIRVLLATTDCISGACNEQLRKVKVACPHCEAWSGILGVNRANVSAHLTECDGLPVPCHGCGVAVIKRLLAAHEAEECSSREVECEHCHDRVSFGYMHAVHIKQAGCETCVPCKLDCGQRVDLRKGEAQHDSECACRKVRCPACNDSLPARELEAHEASHNYDPYVYGWQECVDMSCFDYLPKLGMIHLAVEMMETHPDSQEHQDSACALVSTASSCDLEEEKVHKMYEAFISAGGVEFVIKAMKRPSWAVPSDYIRDTESVVVACRALFALFDDGDQSLPNRARERFVKAGGIETTVATMLRQPKARRIQIHTLSVLWSLFPPNPLPELTGAARTSWQSFHRSVCKRLAAAGGVRCVRNAIKCQDSAGPNEHPNAQKWGYWRGCEPNGRKRSQRGEGSRLLSVVVM